MAAVTPSQSHVSQRPDHVAAFEWLPISPDSPQVARNPHGRCGAKPKLPNNLVTVTKNFAYAHRVIPGCDISRNDLLFNPLY